MLDYLLIYVKKYLFRKIFADFFEHLLRFYSLILDVVKYNNILCKIYIVSGSEIYNVVKCNIYTFYLWNNVVN